MRCIVCRSGRKLNRDLLCRKCQWVIDKDKHTGLKRDRFWLVMVGVPLALLAGLGTVLVVAAMAR